MNNDEKVWVLEMEKMKKEKDLQVMMVQCHATIDDGMDLHHERM